MNWKIGEHIVSVPDQIPPNLPFNVRVGGKDYVFLIRGKTIYRVEGECEKPILIRRLDIKNDEGERQVTLEARHESKEIRVNCEASFHVPGQDSRKQAAKAGGFTLKSPLTGKVIAVPFKEGDQVSKGDTIAVVEAMKMENKLFSKIDGTIAKIHVKEGDAVQTGQVLASVS